MSPDTSQVRLSQLPTSWSVVLQAHDSQLPAEVVQAARQEMLDRYSSVARRYLRSALRTWPNSDDLGEEAFQTFAVRLLTGSFKGAKQERGRFRDYLRTMLRNLATDLQRREQKRAVPLGDYEPVAPADAGVESDQEFLSIWRDELVSHALRALQDEERATKNHLHTVLRFQMDNPKLRSHQAADALGPTIGKKVDAGWVRKRLHVARKRMAELLVQEVARSLDAPTHRELEDELIEIGLFEPCRAAIEALSRS